MFDAMQTETRNQPAQSVRTQGETSGNRACPSKSDGSASGSTATIADGMAGSTTQAGNFAQKALLSRGIDPETVVRLGIYTGRTVQSETGETSVVPDDAGNIVVSQSEMGMMSGA